MPYPRWSKCLYATEHGSNQPLMSQACACMQAYGSGAYDAIGVIFQRCVLFMLAHCIPITFVQLAVPELLKLAGEDAELCRLASAYALRLLPSLYLEALSRWLANPRPGLQQQIMFHSAPWLMAAATGACYQHHTSKNLQTTSSSAALRCPFCADSAGLPWQLTVQNLGERMSYRLPACSLLESLQKYTLLIGAGGCPAASQRS